MSWATFKTDPWHIKARESTLFGGSTDDEAQDLMIQPARDAVERDLLDAVPDGDIEVLCVNYATHIKRALAYMQLHLWFIDNATGEGTVNDMKAEHYLSLYNNDKTRFATFRAGSSKNVKVQSLWR